MKKLFAVAAAMSLGACATMENGNGNDAAARAALAKGKQYCWESRLGTAGGRHNCNWSADKAAACEGLSFTTLDASGYSSPRASSMCANGRWLVEMSPLK